jgi:hypothetical protein
MGPAEWPQTRWRRPEVPLAGVETQRAVLAVHEDGVLRPVMASDGRVDKSGKQSDPGPVFQTCFKSGQPVGMLDALEYEIGRLEHEQRRQLAGGAL